MPSNPRSRARTKATPPAPEPTPAPPADPPASPLFMQPAEPPADLPEGLTQERADRIMEGVMESPSLPQWSSSGPSDTAAADGSPSGTLSTADKPAKPKLTKAALRGYAQKAVKAVGGFVAGRLAPYGSMEHQAGLWAPDDDDVRDIADPVAGLVVRRLPAKAAGALNPDVEDAFALVAALVQYVGKQLQKRELIRAALADQPTPDLTGEPETVVAV
jgi:hypothetical protein